MVDSSSLCLDENKNDFLKLDRDQEVRKFVRDEQLLFSYKLKKINHWGFSQERNILITNKAIYNLKKTSLKRRIDYIYVRGITVSKFNDEFIIHCNEDQYDYYFISNMKKKIIEFIGFGFNEQTKNNLKICELDAKSLKNMVTSKKEKKKDIQFSKMPEINLISVNTYLFSKSEVHPLLKKGSIVQRSNTIFSKKKNIKEVKLEDFKQLKILGRGSFSKVTLVEYNQTKEIFAMKSLKKDVLIDQDQIQNTLLEKKILASLDHCFLVGLVFCFQTIERLYFVMPFMRYENTLFRGGDLFQHLTESKQFDEDRVRFYAAQIALAIDHLHSFGIIYRDLKPENILLDDEGYVKIVDFGMAKHLIEGEKTMSFCGTPEYLAPEIITGEGHNKAADWWSFGILIYEMLIGIPPFYNENIDRMYELIRLSEIPFPRKKKISTEAQDIITRLLDRNTETRLGVKSGLKELKNHPFFTKIDFDMVQQKKLIPSFKPDISCNTDVRNFPKELTESKIEESFIPDSNLDLIKKNSDKFTDF